MKCSIRILALLAIIFLNSIYCFGEQKQDSLTKNTTTTEVNINIPPNIQIKNVSEKNQSFLEKNMPWVAALLIGIISAAINIIVAQQLRKSNENNLQKQLESNEKTKLVEFKATIAAKNRQEWLNDLRNTLSELIATANCFILENNTSKHLESIKELTYKIYSYKSKISMLLNSEKDEQRELLLKIDEFVVEIINKKFNSDLVEQKERQVIASARKIFDIHWKKIKNLT
jgi:hypothetical protein